MTADGLDIVVNGAPRRVPAGTTVAALVEQLGLSRNRLACEVNQVIVRRADYDATRLREGDTVELIQMVGGG
jgi:sulfur carrier protein